MHRRLSDKYPHRSKTKTSKNLRNYHLRPPKQALWIGGARSIFPPHALKNERNYHEYTPQTTY